jgi:phage/plasmid-associated DNA primase
MVPMKQDFYGKEDFDVTAKLLAERAGILNWAMEGWRRLEKRGFFTQPGSGVELLQRLRANTSTIGMFVTWPLRMRSTYEAALRAVSLARIGAGNNRNGKRFEGP